MNALGGRVGAGTGACTGIGGGGDSVERSASICAAPLALTVFLTGRCLLLPDRPSSRNGHRAGQPLSACAASHAVRLGRHLHT